MSIKVIKNEYGEMCPVICCDYCGKQVAADSGVAAWAIAARRTPDACDVVFVHAGDCYREMFDVDPNTESIGNFVDQLRHNTHALSSLSED